MVVVLVKAILLAQEEGDPPLHTWGDPPLHTPGYPLSLPVTLTEHGHELLGVEVPVAPVGPVAVQRGVLLMVVRRLRPKGVDDADSAPVLPRSEPGLRSYPSACPWSRGAPVARSGEYCTSPRHRLAV